jgi:3-phenylpropionate/cinnamic acid dioxygenase small subunit
VGHDFPLYQSVLEESKHFAIDRLQKWLCEQKYLDTVKIRYVATETHARQRHCLTGSVMSRDRFIEIETRSNMETTMDPMTPQGNSFCANGKDRWQRSGEELKWCIVQKEVIFDHELCVNAFREDEQ